MWKITMYLVQNTVSSNGKVVRLKKAIFVVLTMAAFYVDRIYVGRNEKWSMFRCLKEIFKTNFSF